MDAVSGISQQRIWVVYLGRVCWVGLVVCEYLLEIVHQECCERCRHCFGTMLVFRGKFSAVYNSVNI